MGNVLHDPNHWRQRAEETRTKAEGFRLAERERERLLKIAAEYDQIAARAERWQTASE